METNIAQNQKLWRVILALASAVVVPPTLAAQDEPSFSLGLDEILNMEITSVSKKPQTVSQAAAAVFVITADDIRRSGATTIADALRMAPGLNVGQISSNSWAVSSRGVNGRFTNKLLVLMDGRSVYTPTFSGVYWDVQDTMLADIERIEVVRGPGAALWGANAVNGVINIITKSAAATVGGKMTVGAGSEARGSASIRYGGELGDMGHWRAYAKGFDRDGSVVEATGAAGQDTWRQQRAGFRTDLAAGNIDKVTLQGDYYTGRSGDTSMLNFLTPPFNVLAQTSQKVSGGNLLGRWQRDISATDTFTVQTYIDHIERDWPAHVKEKRDTFDLDFQYRTRRFAGHDLVAGTGYRLNRDTIEASFTGIPANTLQHAVFSPQSSNPVLLSAFMQDDITLSPEKLILTLGMKLENNDYTGVEVQPNTRLLWTPTEASTFWGAISKASRTPSRIDRGGVVNQTVLAPMSAQNPLPFPILLQGTGVVDSESLVAYEAGWKHRLSRTFNFDLATYYNDYDKLRSIRFDAPLCQPAGIPVSPACFFPVSQRYVVQPLSVANLNKARSHGVEISVDWRPQPSIRLQAALSQFAMKTKDRDDVSRVDLPGSVPQRQGYLHVAWNPRPDTDIDAEVRHVGRLSEVTFGLEIPRYTELDLRLAWRPAKNVEVAVSGRNLLNKRHPEFASELLDVPAMQIQRSVFGQIYLKF